MKQRSKGGDDLPGVSDNQYFGLNALLRQYENIIYYIFLLFIFYEYILIISTEWPILNDMYINFKN